MGTRQDSLRIVPGVWVDVKEPYMSSFNELILEYFGSSAEKLNGEFRLKQTSSDFELEIRTEIEKTNGSSGYFFVEGQRHYELSNCEITLTEMEVRFERDGREITRKSIDNLNMIAGFSWRQR